VGQHLLVLLALRPRLPATYKPSYLAVVGSRQAAARELGHKCFLLPFPLISPLKPCHHHTKFTILRGFSFMNTRSSAGMLSKSFLLEGDHETADKTVADQDGTGLSGSNLGSWVLSMTYLRRSIQPDLGEMRNLLTISKSANVHTTSFRTS
jgi:hypothetical protein